MQDTLKISDQGLRLIKAFEGYRPVDRELVSGGRVVGYGHRVRGDRAMRLSREEADALLREDLAPYEDMLNSNVFAPLTQAQFDALASLAFNIGPKAFLDSDVLRAVNAGRPLEAANGFDAWRKARVGGDVFVVDALVRRRTAEKALFLRPPDEALAPKAPRVDLEPARDGRVLVFDPEPVLDRDAAGRIVSDAPYDIERLITSMPKRRAEDRPAGELAEAERAAANPPATIYAGLDSVLDAMPAREPEAVEAAGVEEEDDILELGEADLVVDPEPQVEPRRSPIAEAADEVRDRLEALMDSAPDREVPPAADWPESLITADIPDDDEEPSVMEAPAPRGSDNVVSFAPRPPANDPVEEPAPVARIDLLDADEVMGRRPEVAPAIDWVNAGETRAAASSAWPYVAQVMAGGALFGAGAALMLRDVDVIFGQPGRLVGLGAALIGGMILLGALTYLLKHFVRES